MNLSVSTGKTTLTQTQFVVGQEVLGSNLVQRNHRVGHGKDEVDVVLRHLLCDQSERGVILQGSETDAVVKDNYPPSALGGATGAKVLQNNIQKKIVYGRHGGAARRFIDS